MSFSRHCLCLAFVVGLAGACSPASDGPSTPGAGGSGQAGGSAGSGTGGRGGTSGPGGAGGTTGGASGSGTGGSAGSQGGSGGTGGATGAGGSAGSGGGSGGSGASGGSSTPADAGGGKEAAAPDAGGEVGGAPADPTSAAPVPSPACAGMAMLPGPNGNQTFMDRGRNRSFIIRLPTGYEGKKPLPIFFAFHGAGGGASAFEGGAFGGISRMIADRAVRVFPQALGSTWARDEPDDVLYMDAVMEWLKTRVCYDSARVYAGGQSSGAYFSHRWACDRGSVVRGVATNSGGQRRERTLDCKSPVSSWTSTGLGDNPGHVMGTRQARDVWAKLAGCTTAGAMPVSPSPCQALPGCRPGYKVHHCEHGGGHAVPGYAAGGIVNFLFGPGAP